MIILIIMMTASYTDDDHHHAFDNSIRQDIDFGVFNEHKHVFLVTYRFHGTLMTLCQNPSFQKAVDNLVYLE